jgi:hypothetical protein
MARAGDVTKLIPGDALGYVVIHHLGDTDSKIQALGKRIKAPIPSLLPLAKLQTGIAEGIDTDGSIAAAMVPTAQGPSAVLFIPVSDYAVFVKQLAPERTEDDITTGMLMGKPVIVGKKSGHAVVAWPNNRPLLQKVISAQAADKIATGTVKTLEGDNDVVVVISLSGVKILADLGQKGLKEMKGVMQQQLGDDNPALAGIEVYVHLLNAINSEVTGFAARLNLDKDGSLRVNESVWVKPDGQVAPILRNLKPYDGDLFAGLPDVPYVVAFSGVIPQDAFKPMMDFSGNMMKSMEQLYGLSPEQVDKMMELAVQFFPDLQGMSFVLGTGRDDAPLYSEMLGAMRVSDAKGFMTKYRQYWVELDKLIGDAEDSFLKDVTLEDIKLDDTAVLKISMPMTKLLDLDLDLPNQGNLGELMEKMYGPDGITMYLAAADEHTVLMAYTDTALLRKALQTTTDKKKNFSQDANVAGTAKLLPAGAQMVGFWSPSGTMTFVNRLMKLMGVPDTGIQIPAFPDTPPVGFAMTTTPSVVKFNTVVPVETIEAVGSYVEKVKQLNDAKPENNE